MKYSNPSVRDRGGGHWQARFRYKEGDKWRTLSRNLEATSKRDANRKASQLHRRLEEEAERARLRVLLVMDEDEAVLERILEKYISGIEGSGQIERTTVAGYRSSAAHICRYLGDVRIDDITADMIVTMQRRLLTEDGLCSDSVAKDHRLLKQALSYAVETGALAKSPFTKSLKAPKRRRRETAPAVGPAPRQLPCAPLAKFHPHRRLSSPRGPPQQLPSDAVTKPAVAEGHHHLQGRAPPRLHQRRGA